MTARKRAARPPVAAKGTPVWRGVEDRDRRDAIARALELRAELFRAHQAAHYARRELMAERVSRHPEIAELVLDGRIPFSEAFTLVVRAGVGGPDPEAVRGLVADMDRLWEQAPDLAEQVDLPSHRAKFALAKRMGVLQEYCG